ncbi:hypothetical protein C8F04DRAFT_1277271 [Mycena alexandri]|uniref:Uncharacterized protein n=1 Tax=Mycena alexandri TaxID=1745969 RepID=A0AAD6S0U4_9AGAR|nr:hypothetical protein C8F04DRAFT_1277271 [Mycena alexandri]
MDHLLSLTDLLARDFPGLAAHPAFTQLRTGISRTSSQQSSPLPQHDSPTRSDTLFDDPFAAGPPSGHSLNSPPPGDEFSYLFSPGPLSPAPSSRSPSPTPSSGKRKRARLDSDGEDDEDEDEEEEDNNAPKKKKKKKRKCRNDEASAKRRKQDKIARLRGGAGSETPAAERKAGDLRDHEESPSKAKDKGEFVGDGTPPKTTAKGGEFLGQLSRVASKEGQEALESFILELVEFHTAPTQNTIPPGSRTEDIIHTLECPGEIAKNGEKLIKKGRVLDFHMLLMFARFRFAMHKYVLLPLNALWPYLFSLSDGMTHQVRAEKMGFKEEKSSRNYMQRGQRVLDLAGGVAGNAIGSPQSNDSWGNSARILVPYIQRLYHDPRLNFLSFGSNIFSEEEMDRPDFRFTRVKLDFKEIAYNDTLLSRLKTNSPPLRPRATKIWDKIFNPPVFLLPPVAPKLESIHSNIEENHDTYVRFDTKILNGKALSIQGIADQGELDNDVALILTDMREALGPIVDTLPDLINAAYGDGTIHSDSRAEGFAVEAIHLEPAYNRYAEKGKGAPLDDHHMHFIHRANYPRANHGQRIPWVSKDITKDQDSYASLVSVLTGMCEYLADRLCYHRPDLVGKLEAYINILPYNAACPWAPFGGVVVNFNACSDAHLDGWDLFKRCLVVPLMRDCKGGALVLYEGRLVLDLHTADAILFPSGRFTHFNLHYVGMRASLVFHTDAGSLQWTEGEGANEWFNGKFGVKLDRPEAV